MKKYLYFSLSLLTLAACTTSNNSVQTVEAYLDAYNQHDIEGMFEYLSDDVKWKSVAEDKISIETDTKEKLKSVLEGYFQDIPSTRSEIQHVAAHGNFVNAFEKASWTNKEGETQQQCAASVYELEEGLIKNIWYHKSFACE